MGGDRRALLARELGHAIARVDVHDARPVAGGFFRSHPPVGRENDEISGINEVGSSAVDADLARPAPARDDVRLQPRAVRDVVDVDLLVLEEPRGFNQVEVDRDRSNVVDISSSHRRAVYLAQ
jgi:hypothetical protein